MYFKLKQNDTHTKYFFLVITVPIVEYQQPSVVQKNYWCLNKRKCNNQWKINKNQWQCKLYAAHDIPNSILPRCKRWVILSSTRLVFPVGQLTILWLFAPWFGFGLVRLDVEVSKHDKEHNGVWADPVDKQDGVAAVCEKQLHGVNGYHDKLGLKQMTSNTKHQSVHACMCMHTYIYYIYRERM